MNGSPRTDAVSWFRHFGKQAALWLLIATLAWAPFPLGGGIAWAAGLQEVLIAVCWLLWVASTVRTGEWSWRDNRVIAVPVVLALVALAWAVIQSSPGVPSTWDHPIWGMAGEMLHEKFPATISLNPWRTESEIVKLGSYVLTALLAFRMARASEKARTLHNAVLTIGAVYAAYAILLAFSGYRQTDAFYALPHLSNDFSGTFVSRNNFATFMGIVVITATARLCYDGSSMIITGRGWRNLMTSVLEYCFGSGALLLVAVVLCVACVIAGGSRAGFAATMIGLCCLALFSSMVARHHTSRKWAGLGALAVVLPLLILILANGDTLANRLSLLLDTGTADQVRLDLWDATLRMIGDSPWLGLGLGTFQDAYPLYATKVYAYVMDKAHCDYLEFAAGLGLPAAIAWWSAMLWVIVLCVRGVVIRQRNRVYCLSAAAVSMQIAVHSAVDFSLQLPSIALLYAVILGIGVGQSQPTRSRS